MQSQSLFTRLTAAEEELRTVTETLAQILDVLAEMRANQEQMRADLDERLLADQPLTDQRRPWWPPRDDASFLSRALRSIRGKITGAQTSSDVFDGREPHTISNDDVVFWKELARTAITGLFLLSIFMIGVYQLLKYG